MEQELYVSFLVPDLEGFAVTFWNTCKLTNLLKNLHSLLKWGLCIKDVIAHCQCKQDSTVSQCFLIKYLFFILFTFEAIIICLQFENVVSDYRIRRKISCARQNFVAC